MARRKPTLPPPELDCFVGSHQGLEVEAHGIGPTQYTPAFDTYPGYVSIRARLSVAVRFSGGITPDQADAFAEQLRAAAKEAREKPVDRVWERFKEGASQ